MKTGASEKIRLGCIFALRWCFEDEATAQTESLLTLLQNQEAIASVTGIWRYEMLNALGKGISRERLSLNKALLLWQEIQALSLGLGEVGVDGKLLELAQMRGIATATVDAKLQRAAESIGTDVINRSDWLRPRASSAFDGTRAASISSEFSKTSMCHPTRRLLTRNLV